MKIIIRHILQKMPKLNCLKGFVSLPILAQTVKGEVEFHRAEAKQIVIFPINVSGECNKALRIKK